MIVLLFWMCSGVTEADTVRESNPKRVCFMGAIPNGTRNDHHVLHHIFHYVLAFGVFVAASLANMTTSWTAN